MAPAGAGTAEAGIEHAVEQRLDTTPPLNAATTIAIAADPHRLERKQVLAAQHRNQPGVLVR
jgi:hypothetical protein